MKLKELTPEEKRIIIDKDTERPFSGKYYMFNEDGVYTCKQCGVELFRSGDKFASDCGWPSFDDKIPGAVKFLSDPDGQRVEIECAKCSAHLGHIFYGERLTKKNVGYCVNSISLEFQSEIKPSKYQKPDQENKEIVVGGGCFWCTEAIFQKLDGVLNVTSGYAGGSVKNPTYKEVCAGDTGHAEVIKIEYNPVKVTLKKILDLFFLIHDPTTLNRQGADVGTQYRSIIFYSDKKEKDFIFEYIRENQRSFAKKIVTEVLPLSSFYKAEDYHKDYYNNHKTQSYCRIVISTKLEKTRNYLDKSSK
jgi:peptide methionine sulfoxide reductase msrA/msrB